MLKKAHKDFEQNARALIREGTEKVCQKILNVRGMTDIRYPVQRTISHHHCTQLDYSRSN